jgi:hypothetical protein
MAIAKRFLSLLQRRPAIVLVAVFLVALYSASYRFRRQFGLAHPMANMAYYYYGAYPNTVSDRALYWFYFPAHLFGDRLGIHWSDRRDKYDPSYF